MRKLLLTMAMMVMPVAALAQSPGPVLWQNISAGMTAPEVQALYPTGTDHKGIWEVRDIDVLGGCKATAYVDYRSGTVMKVTLSGKHKLMAAFDMCNDRMRDAVLAKYGQPANARDDASNSEHNFGLASEGFVWSVNGVMVRFHHSDWGSTWSMEYDATVVGSKL